MCHHICEISKDSVEVKVIDLTLPEIFSGTVSMV